MEKKVADDLGENLPKGARQFFRSNTFKIMTDPRICRTLSDFGKKFSDELVNSSSALGKADVSFEMRQLAKDLNFSQGVADDLLKPLENYCTDIIERRNNLIEAIAKRDFGGTSEAALRQARGKFHDMMEAKRQAGLRMHLLLLPALWRPVRLMRLRQQLIMRVRR